MMEGNESNVMRNGWIRQRWFDRVTNGDVGYCCGLLSDASESSPTATAASTLLDLIWLNTYKKAAASDKKKKSEAAAFFEAIAPQCASITGSCEFHIR